MRLDAREPQRHPFSREIRDRLGARQQCRACAFVRAPGARRRQVHRGIGILEPPVIGREQVAALGLGQRFRERAPRFRKQGFQAIEKPLDLAAAAQENAAQHEPGAVLGMRFAVRQRERAAPRAAEHQPALDAEVPAQPFDVGYQVRRRVVAQLTERRRAPGPALVENDDAVVSRIEETPVRGGGACAGPAVQEQHRHSMRVSRLLPVHGVHAVQLQHASAVGLGLGIQFRARLVGDVGHDGGFYNGGRENVPRRISVGAMRPGAKSGAGTTSV